MTLQRFDPDFGRLSIKGSPVRKITQDQVVELVEAVPWVNWKPVVEKRDLNNRNDGSVRMRLKPVAVSIDDALQTVPRPSQVRVWGPPTLVMAGTLVAWWLFSPVAGGLFTLLALVAFCVILIWLNIRSVTARFDYLHHCHAVRYLIEWLNSADGIVESVPKLWVDGRADPEVGEFLIHWFHQRLNIESLNEYIAEGVQMRKHLSPIDPRRRVMQVEINAQRAKRDALNVQREELANRISSLAATFREEQERQMRDQERECREAEDDRQQYAEFKRRWEQIDVTARKRLDRDEAIDLWFDQGSAGE